MIEFQVRPVEWGGQLYVILVEGYRRQVYQVKASAKKFSAQMEKLDESAIPEALRSRLDR